MSTLKVDNLQTSTGAGLYPARCWCTLNGLSTLYIMQSGNVSSVTDSGTGTYEINFLTAAPHAQYSIVATAKGFDSTDNSGENTIISNNVPPTTTKFRIVNSFAGNSVLYDSGHMSVVCFW